MIIYSNKGLFFKAEQIVMSCSASRSKIDFALKDFKLAADKWVNQFVYCVALISVDAPLFPLRVSLTESEHIFIYQQLFYHAREEVTRNAYIKEIFWLAHKYPSM